MTSPLWNPEVRLALASKSVTRQELLARAGLPFETVAAEVDERAVEAGALKAGLAVRHLARALAAAKALTASRALAEASLPGRRPDPDPRRRNLA